MSEEGIHEEVRLYIIQLNSSFHQSLEEMRNIIFCFKATINKTFTIMKEYINKHLKVWGIKDLIFQLIRVRCQPGLIGPVRSLNLLPWSAVRNLAEVTCYDNRMGGGAIVRLFRRNWRQEHGDSISIVGSFFNKKRNLYL